MSVSAPDDPYPTLGRYQVINRIASGGMAEVFLARATGAMGFQRLVAVKLIHANFTRDTDFVNMFIDEARIAMHLHHRNIVQVFDLDSENDTYFIAMEYVHGPNLYDVYERIAGAGRWFESSFALYVIAEVCKGLHFAHTRTTVDGRPLGIIHRDISPQNVLLSLEGEVKITDFGIATAAERLHQTAAGIVKGKYAYMAPERLQEQPVDARADVFSAGVLLYELLTGENPFASASAVETIEAVLGKEVEPPSSRGARVSRRLDEITLRALARKPADRFPSAQALADALTEYAMELTHARKDMAAGDAAVSTLLNELFPDKVANPPGPASPGSFDLPGVIAETSSDEHTAEVAQDELEDTMEPADATIPTPALGQQPQSDDPTVLRMTPVKRPLNMHEAPTGSDERPMVRDDSGMSTLDTATGQKTGPTMTPGIEPLPQMGSLPKSNGLRLDEDDDPFASTILSSETLDSLEGDDTNRAQVSTPMPVAVQPAQVPTPAQVATPAQVPMPAQVPAAPPMPMPFTPVAQPVPLPMQAPLASFSGEQSAAVVQPVMHDAAPPRSRTNLVAGLLLAVAAIVVAAAVVVVQKGSSPELAALTVTSIPAKASVEVNGRPKGDLPLTLEIPVGESAVIDLSIPGYEPFRQEITPQDGSPISIEHKFKEIRGTITVKPNPEDATVRVQGLDRGTGVQKIEDLALNTQIRVEVLADKHEPHIQSVVLSTEESSQTLNVALSRASGKRSTTDVVLKMPPQQFAKVYYKGQYLGDTPVKATLPIGKVELQIKSPSLGIDRKVEVTVPRSRSGTSEIEIKP